VKRKGSYIPEGGDAVWIILDPQAGHEQPGRRPALVLSPSAYNGRVGLALLCPITNRSKGYPFEVPLPEGLPATSVVGADQVKNLDWRARKASRFRDVPDGVVSEVVRCLRALLGEDGDSLSGKQCQRRLRFSGGKPRDSTDFSCLRGYIYCKTHRGEQADPAKFDRHDIPIDPGSSLAL
jgi:mRNA interferase MazF